MEIVRVWPIVCQFGIGALLCLVGVWAGVRSGYLNWSDPGDRRILLIVVAGYVGLLLLYCAFTFWLPFAVEEVAS